MALSTTNPKSITAISAILTINIPALGITGHQVQGFSADDAFSFEEVNSMEEYIGVDGQLKTVWIGDVVNPALEIGVINAGINLDNTQRVTIDSLTGVDGAGDIVAANGWYLSVTDPTANARANRESPVCIFVYTSGQSIQKIELPIYNAQ